VTCGLHMLIVLMLSADWIYYSRANDREMKTIMQDRDRMFKNLQEQEAELHRLELKESNLRNEVQQREYLEENIGHHKKEINSSTTEMKVRLVVIFRVQLYQHHTRKSMARLPKRKLLSSNSRGNIKVSRQIWMLVTRDRRSFHSKSTATSIN
jgi:hypothetical protein